MDDQINTIQDGAGESFLVTQDLMRLAVTGVIRVIEIATWTGIHSTDEHKIGRISRMLAGAADSDSLVFKWLTKSFKHRARKFGQFIKKQDAAVGEGDFSRQNVGSTADDSSSASGMMRRSKGAASRYRRGSH